MDDYWLCQSAGTPIPVWDSELLLTAPLTSPAERAFLRCGEGNPDIVRLTGRIDRLGYTLIRYVST